VNIITRHFQVIQHTADTKDNTLFDFTYSHDDGKAVPKGTATLSSNGYCCIQLNIQPY